MSAAPAQTAPVATTATTAPVGKDGKPKKEKKVKLDKDGKPIVRAPKIAKRVAHPGIDPKNPFEVMPTDFDFSKHKGLKKKDFKDETGYSKYLAANYRFNAGKLVKRADALDAKAERMLKFGDEKTRKKAGRVEKLKAQLAKLQAELGADGVDLAALGLAGDAPATPVAAS